MLKFKFEVSRIVDLNWNQTPYNTLRFPSPSQLPAVAFYRETMKKKQNISRLKF